LGDFGSPIKESQKETRSLIFVESQSGLGIYVNKSRATVLCLHRHKVKECFSVTLSEESTEPVPDLMRQVAETCVEKRLTFSDVTVALDCTWFMQHRVHSEFTSLKQIGATIRFDTEEVVATDIANLAVGFAVVETKENGTDLNVFTADHAVLSDVVLTLQSHGIDPVRVVPDVCSLSQVIGHEINAKTYAYSDGLFAILSRHNGYFLRYSDKQGCMPVRAFLVGTQKNKNDVLSREILTTMASSSASAPEGLMIYDATDSADPAALAERVSIPVEALDWLTVHGAGPQALAQGGDPVDCAIALGAARMTGESSLNFRNDFMPFQGKKMRLQSAMKWMCFSMTLLLLAVGGRMQAKWFQVRQDRASLHTKLLKDYQAVMPGSKKETSLIADLAKETRKINDLKQGRNPQGANSTSAKLILMLKAINASYTKAGLDIKEIAITKDVRVVGSTSKADGRLEFAEAVKKTGLGNPVSKHGDMKQARWPFSMTIETKAGGAKP
jgi:hypothetical protein